MNVMRDLNRAMIVRRQDIIWINAGLWSADTIILYN